jgi:starch synthase (maltosyl-transferring)
VIAYSKREGDDLVFIVVNLDPSQAVEARIDWEMWVLGMEKESFDVIDQLDGKRHTFHRSTRVRIDPSEKSGSTPYGRVAYICTLA